MKDKMKERPNFNSRDYKALKGWAKDSNITVATRKVDKDIFDAAPYNGVSVAFKPMMDGEDCRMVAVAVSYCSAPDEYKKKTGKYQALNKLEIGQYVQLPLGEFLRISGPKTAAGLLLDMFGTI